MLSGATHPAVLSHLAHAFRDDEERCEKLALNPATDDATIAFLATLPFKRVVEIVSNNQERMLRAPEIVDALGDEPAHRPLGHRSHPRLPRRRASPAKSAEIDDGPTSATTEAEAALRAVLGDDLGHLARELVEERDGDRRTTRAATSTR